MIKQIKLKTPVIAELLNEAPIFAHPAHSIRPLLPGSSTILNLRSDATKKQTGLFRCTLSTVPPVYSVHSSYSNSSEVPNGRATSSVRRLSGTSADFAFLRIPVAILTK